MNIFENYPFSMDRFIYDILAEQGSNLTKSIFWIGYDIKQETKQVDGGERTSHSFYIVDVKGNLNLLFSIWYYRKPPITDIYISYKLNDSMEHEVVINQPTKISILEHLKDILNSEFYTIKISNFLNLTLER